jgi:hypothetical protein
MGQRQGPAFFSATAELCLLKQPLVKSKFLSLSEVLSLNLLYEVLVEIILKKTKISIKIFFKIPFFLNFP